MKMKNFDIKVLISVLGYTAKEGDKDIFYKCYSNQNDYFIYIDFDNEKIQYGDKIILGDHTTSNFENSENFVVLECVDRLLENGYAPASLSLEHKLPVGHREKGKLDILVSDDNNKAYLMIECKTYGTEYDNEKRKMLIDGGQLFTYYAIDTATKFLCLYSSMFDGQKISYVNSIISIDSTWKQWDTSIERFHHWNKKFKSAGIFESSINPYGVQNKAIVKGSLKALTMHDSSKIFNQFAEILRHNVVSDKPNAFNKMLNLFICKIIDEDKTEDEDVSFQWYDNDTDEELQLRLNDLYKHGMKKFLDIDVTDFTDEQLNINLTNINEENMKQIQRMFMQLRLQKNPEFAFKEVFDKQSFDCNAAVVREVVELLQNYQFRYGHKQQFLGNFFELLLNTSIKQESGQFFTPTPIARFIISSLPIKEMIMKKIAQNDNEILPVAIDYAAGSGHFITEWLDIVQGIIEELDTKKLRPEAIRKINTWNVNEFSWAKDFVYGIEADYRLVKTTKVSSFLNGDGDAVIIHADGLDNFKTSTTYRGKLKESSKVDGKENGAFDVLIANPPYSVSAFKNTVKDGSDSFELFDKFTDSSSEIECLFVERAKQLLKIGGYAGIILPSSILSNAGIYSDAREMILKYFNIKGITKFGSNTFMATGTNTVALFLERRPNIDSVKIIAGVKSFFDRPKDATVYGIENAFGKYVKTVFNDISLEDYITLVNKNPNDKIKKQEFYKDYVNWFNILTEIKNIKCKKAFNELSDKEQMKELNRLLYLKLFEKEQEKILYFLLAIGQKTVVIDVGEKQSEKEFLGYEFSNRRGHEGIRMYNDDNGKLSTKLFDSDNILNSEKVNSYIYRAFLGEDIIIDPSLAENISVYDTVDLIDFSKLHFEKAISLNPKKKILLKSKYPLRKLGEICDVRDGTHDSPKFQQNGFPLITSKNITSGSLDFTDVKLISEKDFNDINQRSLVEENDILFAMIGTVGSPVIVDTNKKFAIKNVALFKFKGNILLLNKYLKEVLNFQIVKDQIDFEKKGSNRTFVSLTTLRNLLIPLPPKDIQEKIVSEICILEGKEKQIKEKIYKLSLKLSKAQYFNYPEVKLEKISKMVCRGKSAKYGDSKIQIIKSGQARGYKKFDFSRRHYVSGAFISDERNLIKDDILINSTGVGTAGRVTLFDLDGDFVADSHITIVRLDKLKALPKYVLYSLANIGFKNIEKMATGQSGQVELSLSILNDIKIPLPSIDEQLIIVEEIEEVENQVAELEENILLVNGVRQSILKKYL